MNGRRSAVARWLEPARVATAVATAVTGAGCVAVGVAPPRASAAPIGRCTTHSGTIVAVDFQHWGGPIVRGCGVGRHSGYDLLHAAGFTTAGDQHDGPAFICRLGNGAYHAGTQYPAPAQEDCVLTPPASAYWSYWLAPAGQDHWTYSQRGAMSEVPKPGEVELWIFGATNIAGTRGSGVPPFSPDTLRAHNASPHQPQPSQAHQPAAKSSATRQTTTSPPPTTASTTQTTPPAPTPATTPATRHHRDARPRAPHARARRHPTRSRHRVGVAASTVASSVTTTSSSASPPSRTAPPLVAARATGERTPSSSAAPLVIGISLVLLLSAGAAWTIWQRRRYE